MTIEKFLRDVDILKYKIKSNESYHMPLDEEGDFDHVEEKNTISDSFERGTALDEALKTKMYVLAVSKKELESFISKMLKEIDSIFDHIKKDSWGDKGSISEYFTNIASISKLASILGDMKSSMEEIEEILDEKKES